MRHVMPPAHTSFRKFYKLYLVRSGNIQLDNLEKHQQEPSSKVYFV